MSSSNHSSVQKANDINTLSTFLTNNQISNLQSYVTAEGTDILVSCVSSVLFPTTYLFTLLKTQSLPLPLTLLLVGGKGHSTPHLYSAVKRHPVYHTLYDEITAGEGYSEARVALRILEEFFDGEDLRKCGLKILLEEKSTNCGDNAVKAKEVLDDSGWKGEKLVLYQDCTMSLRTKAGFEKVYHGDNTNINCWTGWTPFVKLGEAEDIAWDMDRIKQGSEIFTCENALADLNNQELWEMERFLGLLMGEIPRFEKYGPAGLGSIVGVTTPEQVASAWERLDKEGVGKGR